MNINVFINTHISINTFKYLKSNLELDINI